MTEVASAWEKKDFTSCKSYLEYLCENTHKDVLIEIMTPDSSTAMEWYKIFIDTGLDCAPGGSHAGKIFLSLNHYICTSDDPIIQSALKSAFNHCFPNIKPVGFNEDGNLYSLEDLADSLGVDPDELLEKAKELPEGDVLQIIDFPSDETIH